MIKLSHLDHIAIRVKDIHQSALWYEKVLGLKRYSFKEWGQYPLFMLSGKTGIALFPIKDEEKYQTGKNNGVYVDHFAFHVNKENFEKAQMHLNRLDIPFELQDHFYVHSIYFSDPDGHMVELTTLVVEENLFYGSIPL